MTIYLDRKRIKTFDRNNLDKDIYVNVEGAIVKLEDIHYAVVNKSKRYLVDKYIYFLTIGFKSDASDKWIKQHVPNISFKWSE